MAKAIDSISIIGSGNVAFHLGRAFRGQITINTVYSRNAKSGQELANELSAKFTSKIADIPLSDLALICVNDDEIGNVIDQLSIEQSVAYTSGSVGLNQLPQRDDLGVFYPLQTFSKNRETNIFEVPFFIEATNEVFAQDLFDLAWMLSRKVSFANSTDRKNLHVAAVMVNNFVNHLNLLAKDFTESKNLNWDHLKPLIKETAAKLQDINPSDSQTGPAIRGDESTISSHLDLLGGNTKEIYKLLSESIQKQHSK